MLGINLGVSLINETQKSVIFVDLSTGENGIPAWSMLKLPLSNSLQNKDLTTASVRGHCRIHSSQLSILTVDSESIREGAGEEGFIKKLFSILREDFDYIVVDISSHSNRITYDVIDETDILILVVSSLEYEQPIGVIGHQDSRIVVNMGDEPTAERTASHSSGSYFIPWDSVAVNAFRRSGVPFVIQSPYRPISQTVGRLARDIGEKQFGIALTGGAALGLSQLGILEVLERNRISIDMITGVSFGALIGAAYAAGIELRRIKQYFVEWAASSNSLTKLSFRSFFKRNFFKETGLQELCKTLLEDVYFEELLIPINVIAVDTRRGESVVFREGKVLDAIQASMRIPGLFVPFKHTEPYLIDSSVIFPTPVSPLKQMGADVTVAIIVTPSPTESHKHIHQKIKGKLSQEERAAKQNYELVSVTFDSLMKHVIETPDSLDIEERVKPDLFIYPEIKGISWRDFYKINDLIDIGTLAAEAVIPNIEKLKWG